MRIAKGPLTANATPYSVAWTVVAGAIILPTLRVDDTPKVEEGT